MLYFYQVATQPHFIPVAPPPPPPIPGGGNAPKTRKRRGGLLHEERYFAALENVAVQYVAAEINQSHPTVKHSHEQEDDEIILLYMASLYGA